MHLNMPLFIAVLVLVVVLAWTAFHIPHEGDLGGEAAEKMKLREGVVLDIRGANQYCLGYIALLGVIATIAAGHHTEFAPVIERVPFWPFAVAFGAATLSVLFVPAGYGTTSFCVLRFVWLRTIVCEQITVVSAGYGIWRLLTVIMG